ncbi:hypothetical protein HZC07_06130 [Candidatus Micrarchaeota archaeon]|nr:hypothetical protein [Candidatus Micrarchaeota archaeon]
MKKSKRTKPSVAPEYDPLSAAGLSMLWQTTRSFFDIPKVLRDRSSIDTLFNSMLPYASLRNGLMLFAFGSLLGGLILLVSNLWIAYLSAFTLKSISETGATVTAASIPSFLQMVLLIFIPLPIGFALVYIQESLSYHVFRKLGGKGEFGQQYYLLSLINFPIIASSILLFLAPIPCANLIGLLIYLVLGFYFGIYIRAKSYCFVHKISFWHSLVVLVFCSLPFIAITFLLSEFLTPLILSLPI